MRTHIKIAMFVAIGVCIGSLIWFGLLGRTGEASQEKPKRTVLSKLPPIKSCLDHIKIIKAELLNQGDSQVAALELENDAYVGVVSISIEQLVDKEKHSVVESGFTPNQPPEIIIPPGGRRTITLENLGAKSPIRIGGVMFSDGTEEGCEPSLKDMRELRDLHTRRGVSQK